MRKIAFATMAVLSIVFASCSGISNKTHEKMESKFNYEVDTFADLQILRYEVVGFEKLSLQQKELIYYLSEAALEGRDILFDQNNRYNLAIRRTLEAIYEYNPKDPHSVDYRAFEVYLKRVWFSNGIHHHYGQDKFIPGFSQDFFAQQVKLLPEETIPRREGQSVDDFLKMITPVMFHPNHMGKKVTQTGGDDLVVKSANNYYGDGISQRDAQGFYKAMRNPKDTTPISYGLNSRLEKVNGKFVENVWKVDGLYSEAITRIVYWLEKACEVAENEAQRETIAHLIGFYESGNLEAYDAYSIAWVKDLNSKVDFVNGFTEVYGDALGIKGSWESLVNFKDEEATKRTEVISSNAQWFEDYSPIDSAFKKKEVKGVTAKVITVAQLGGDCYPATPIGVNLPNADWIRRDHGSKSVTIENIMKAYDVASSGSGFEKEFVWSEEEITLLREYGFRTDVLHTDLHECLGHGSGVMMPGVEASAMGEFHSTIEEARADLFALYYLADPKLLELGLIPTKHAHKAEYYKYMMNGLITQLARIETGKDIEEDHMRNRQLIARWAYEQGAKDKVIELRQREGKTFVVINDYDKLRSLFGQLLREVQRIKSEGDYGAAKEMVTKYAVKVDSRLHEEVLKRYALLNIKPYKGFVNPQYQLVHNAEGKITDVAVSYTEDYTEQMMRYSKKYSTLPTYND